MLRLDDFLIACQIENIEMDLRNIELLQTNRSYV